LYLLTPDIQAKCATNASTSTLLEANRIEMGKGLLVVIVCGLGTLITMGQKILLLLGLS
jgi:hypothetical protein